MQPARAAAVAIRSDFIRLHTRGVPRLLTDPDTAADAVSRRAAVEPPALRVAGLIPLEGAVALQGLGSGHEAICQVGVAGAGIVAGPRVRQHRGAAPGAAIVLAREVHGLGKLGYMHLRVAQRITHACSVLPLQQVHGQVAGALPGDRRICHGHARAIIVTRGAMADGGHIAANRDDRICAETLCGNPGRKDGA